MSLKALLELTDPARETNPKQTARGSLAQLLEATDPERENQQSVAKDLGNTVARGIVDDGIGSSVEGGTRLGLGGLAGIVQGAADAGAQLGLTDRGALEWKIKELQTAEDVLWAKKEGPRAQPGYTFSDEENRRLDDIAKQRAELESQREKIRMNPTAVAYAQAGQTAGNKIQSVRQSVRDALPVDADFQRSTPGQVTSGIGQIIGQVPAYLTGLGLPASVGQMFDQGYQDAKASGADDEMAGIAGVANLPAAVLEYASDKIQLAPLFKAMRAGKLTRMEFAKELVQKGVQSFVTEGSTEGAQQSWQNYIAQRMYDPKRKVMEGVTDAALVGGLTGAAVNTGLNTLDRVLPGRQELDTGENVPESKRTLEMQQQALIAGTVPAQMFPKNSAELPLPKGLARVETERGIFHFNPSAITADQVKKISAAGRENKILGLGPASKADVEAHAAAGEPTIAVQAKAPDGTEIRTAVATPSTAPAAAKAMAQATPGATISQGTPQQTLLQRLAAQEAAQTAAATEARQKEEQARNARQQELAAKRARFDEVIKIAADASTATPDDYSRIKGALETVKSYASDNSLGLTLEQRQRAQRAQSKLQRQFDVIAPQFEYRQQSAFEAVRKAEAEREAARKAKLAQDRQDFAAAKEQGLGADGNIDYQALKDDKLGELIQNGDARAMREFERRELADESTEQPDLLTVLKSVGLPQSDQALGGELSLLVKEEMDKGQRRALVNPRRQGLDETAEILREDYGFADIKTPNDVIEFTRRALRGEEIRPTGSQDNVRFSRSKQTRMSTGEIKSLEKTLRASFPRLFENVDLAIGLVQKELAKRGEKGPIPPGVEAAIYRAENEKTAIIIAAKMVRSNEGGTRLAMHELGHYYWDTLTESSREILRDMHVSEVQAKTGPLYENGRLKKDTAFIEDLDERGHQEWFADRVAEINYRWADGKGRGLTFIDRMAARVRSFLREVASMIWKLDKDTDLFEIRFREFLLSGADHYVGTAAGVRYAADNPDPYKKMVERVRQGGAPIARYSQQGERQRIQEELAKLREGASQEDPQEIERRGVELTARLAALDAAEKAQKPKLKGPASDEQVAASLVNLEEKKDWLPTPEEIDAEKKKPADPKEKLIADWQAAKAERDAASKASDETAWGIAQERVSAFKRTLDLAYPGWDDEQKPAQKPAPTEAKRQEEPPPAEPAEADQADKEKSTFEPTTEPEPDRGRAQKVMGHTSEDPSFLHRTKQQVADFFQGFRGALPKLPTFPEAKWNQKDPFIRREGAAFYNRLKLGINQLRNANDFIQRTAQEQLTDVIDPLLKLGEPIGKAGYRRMQQLTTIERRNEQEGKPMPARLASELADLRKEIEANPLYLFQRTILFLDLQWRRKNLKDSQGNPISLPMGLNGTEADNEVTRLAALVEASPHRTQIEEAIQRHMALVKSVANDLASRDLAAADQLNNPYYFPHLTLEMTDPMDPNKMIPREFQVERVKATTESDFRGYLIDPVGSTKVIETDYAKAMYYHLVQVGAHNMRSDLVRDYVRPYDVMEKVKERAKQLSKERGYTVSWEKTFGEEYSKSGYVLYGSDSGDAFTSIQIDRDKLAQRLGVMLTAGDIQEQLKELGIRGIKLLPDDIKEVMQMGAKETWILPAPVAQQLREIQVEDRARDGAIKKLIKANTSLWKQWKLFMPWNVIRYNFGNLVADFEKIATVDPSMVKEFPAAIREIKALFSADKDLSPELRQAIKYGVVNTVTAQELGQLTGMRNLEELQTSAERARRLLIDNASTAGISSLLQKAGLPSMSSVQLSAFREAVFRYAKFKADLKRLENGSRPAYGGAYWKDIDAITDSKKGAGDANYIKAAQISLKTFGDYSDLSQSGKAVRDYMIPFYSWLEVNMKYHANLFRNLRDMMGSAECSKADKTRAATLAAAGMLARLALPYIAATAWNAASGMEDELSEDDRRRFHIIVGRDESGRPMLITAPTAFLDVIKWFSGPEFLRQMVDVASGRTDLATGTGAWLTQIGPDLVNNTIGQMGPAIRMPYTLLAKKNAFPDITDQRTIPAYDMKRVLLAQATDDFTADVLMRMVDKEYLAPKDFGDWATQLILQVRKRDPEAWAFYEIKDKAADFVTEKTGRSREGGSVDAPHMQAVRNFRKSIYRGDMANAVRFYNILLDYGYTAEQFRASIRAQDPLAEIPKALRPEFLAQLTEAEKTQLERAYRHYSKMSQAKGREKLLFPTKRQSQFAPGSWLSRADALQGLGEVDEAQAEDDFAKSAEKW